MSLMEPFVSIGLHVVKEGGHVCCEAEDDWFEPSMGQSDSGGSETKLLAVH